MEKHITLLKQFCIGTVMIEEQLRMALPGSGSKLLSELWDKDFDSILTLAKATLVRYDSLGVEIFNIETMTTIRELCSQDSVWNL